MDQFTHSAAGLFLGRAGLNRFCAQAPWILLMAANAPDIDIVALAGGPLEYLNYHRCLTHSLAAMPAMALLPVLVARLCTRKPFRWRAAYAISLIGVLSHLLLDLTNAYGVRLLSPFSARWFRLDVTSVWDLWIWVVFLLCFAGPVLVRLVNSEIGARPGGAQRGFAIFALLFVAGYDGGRGVLHARAVATLESRTYRGTTPLRVAAIPGPVNPFAWRGLVEMRDSYSVQDFSLLEDYDPSRAAVYYKAEPSPAVSAANRTEVFRDFFAFSRFPLELTAPQPEGEGATRVEAMDMRFGTPVRPAFVATAVVSDKARVIRSWFEFGVNFARRGR